MIRQTQRDGRYPAAGIVGGILFTLMFAGLIAALFITDDTARQWNALAICAFAVTGGGLLIYAQTRPKQ
ncbi:hypothetical protein QTQ03_22020 [Micromonospora sp. WMMA1363]|uniref:hypothetical protein n=1 Tax=Micromonospora sp. WMMA1363 TaxID=3053985 RepID=UPI00259D18BE|nr:hypothetical protein [Micromonospora sp. WMMA1363]MDM4722136.1 hypothetical protein [Micromonospora sp. WMMA1363]